MPSHSKSPKRKRARSVKVKSSKKLVVRRVRSVPAVSPSLKERCKALGIPIRTSSGNARSAVALRRACLDKLIALVKEKLSSSAALRKRKAPAKRKSSSKSSSKKRKASSSKRKSPVKRRKRSSK